MASIDLPSSNATFLHIPKTAGYSVSSALLDSDADARRLPVRDMDTPVGAAQHLLARTDPGLLARRWSFCFVRDPWDWTVSGWLHVTRNKAAYGTEPPDFEAFVRGRWRVGLSHNPNPAKFTGPHAFVAYHCKITQAAHLAMDMAGNPAPMAFYGRFERLAEDWARICERLGRDLPLAHRNRSERTHYSEYYTDALRDLVAERNRPLIDRFGYRFQS